MGIEIKSSGKDVIASGSFITFDDSPSEITLVQEKQRAIIEIRFSDDDSKELKVKFNTEDQKKLIINFFNFNSGLDSGNTEPLNLGNFGNRTLFLNFRIRRLGKDAKSRSMSYTFYLGDKYDQ